MSMTSQTEVDGKRVTALNCTLSAKGKATRYSFQVALLDKSRLPSTARKITGDAKAYSRM